MGKEQSKEQDYCEQPDKMWEKQSKYTVKELKDWRDQFHGLYPSGRISKTEFKELYAKSYPNSTRIDLYVQQVFRTFDINNDNYIDFNEFMIALEVYSCGSPEEKLKWMFSLFDLNHDGAIIKQEMISILRPLYKIDSQRKGSLSRRGSVERETPDSHANRIFATVDKNNDGKLTFDEFLMLKESDPKLMDLVFGEGMVL